VASRSSPFSRNSSAARNRRCCSANTLALLNAGFLLRQSPRDLHDIVEVLARRLLSAPVTSQVRFSPFCEEVEHFRGEARGKNCQVIPSKQGSIPAIFERDNACVPARSRRRREGVAARDACGEVFQIHEIQESFLSWRVFSKEDPQG
jgi:hypothetical protein